MLARTPDELEKRGRDIIEKLKPALPPGVSLAVEDGEAQMGSGSVPVETIPSKVIALRIREGASGLEALAKVLRYQRPAVFARIHKDALLFDLRTIQPEEDEAVIESVRLLFQG